MFLAWSCGYFWYHVLCPPLHREMHCFKQTHPKVGIYQEPFAVMNNKASFTSHLSWQLESQIFIIAIKSTEILIIAIKHTDWETRTLDNFPCKNAKISFPHRCWLLNQCYSSHIPEAVLFIHASYSLATIGSTSLYTCGSGTHFSPYMCLNGMITVRQKE